MPVYVHSPAWPFVFISELSRDTVVEAIGGWLRAEQVHILLDRASDDVIVNWSAVPVVLVTDAPPAVADRLMAFPDVER